MIEPTSEASVRPLERWRARKLDERLVVVCDAVDVQQDAGHEQSGDDREGRDRCEREDDPAQVGPDRVALAGQSGQPTAERTGLTVEDREGERRARRVACAWARSGVMSAFRGH